MNELQETIKSICDEFADISAILTARSRELDRRELFDKEIETEIKNIKKNYFDIFILRSIYKYVYIILYRLISF